MDHSLLFAAGLESIGGISRSFYAIPLIVVISLVYSASRYESTDVIIRRALRLGLTIGGFMLSVLLLLLFLSQGM